MSEINVNDAPEGYIAVKPEIDSDGDVVCDGCAFDDGLNVFQACYECSSYSRMSEKDVIFKLASSLPCHRNSPRSDDLCSR